MEQWGFVFLFMYLICNMQYKVHIIKSYYGNTFLGKCMYLKHLRSIFYTALAENLLRQVSNFTIGSPILSTNIDP